ncbi:MAG: hypothetical protein IPN99_16335 [Bacteroidetes bacterium]|nr:hypothetical protein [Bacteroidota bacterium]
MREAVFDPAPVVDVASTKSMLWRDYALRALAPFLIVGERARDVEQVSAASAAAVLVLLRAQIAAGAAANALPPHRRPPLLNTLRATLLLREPMMHDALASSQPHAYVWLRFLMPSLNPTVATDDPIPACGLCATGHSSFGCETLLRCSHVALRRIVDAVIMPPANAPLIARQQAESARDALVSRKLIVRQLHGATNIARSVQSAIDASS